jgi:excisionase family DNA binding protein
MARHAARTSRGPKPANSRSAATRRTDLPEFLTVADLQHYLGVGRGLAYELARHDPRLQAVRFGRLLRIPREAVLALARDGADQLQQGRRS